MVRPLHHDIGADQPERLKAELCLVGQPLFFHYNPCNWFGLQRRCHAPARTPQRRGKSPRPIPVNSDFSVSVVLLVLAEDIWDQLPQTGDSHWWRRALSIVGRKTKDAQYPVLWPHTKKSKVLVSSSTLRDPDGAQIKREIMGSKPRSRCLLGVQV